MATRRSRRPPPRSPRRPPAPAHADDHQDQAARARIARLPEPYRSAARLLPDDWRFVELAWLYGLAHNGQDVDAAAAWFPEMKTRHAELFAELLPRARRGRPETHPTRQELTALAPHLRWMYELRRRHVARDRATARLRGGVTPSEDALAWVATHVNIPLGKLRRALFSTATNAAYRAMLKADPGYTDMLIAASRPPSPPQP